MAFFPRRSRFALLRGRMARSSGEQVLSLVEAGPIASRTSRRAWSIDSQIMFGP